MPLLSHGVQCIIVFNWALRSRKREAQSYRRPSGKTGTHATAFCAVGCGSFLPQFRLLATFDCCTFPFLHPAWCQGEVGVPGHVCTGHAPTLPPAVPWALETHSLVTPAPAKHEAPTFSTVHRTSPLPTPKNPVLLPSRRRLPAYPRPPPDRLHRQPGLIHHRFDDGLARQTFCDRAISSLSLTALPVRPSSSTQLRCCELRHSLSTLSLPFRPNSLFINSLPP